MTSVACRLVSAVPDRFTIHAARTSASPSSAVLNCCSLLHATQFMTGKWTIIASHPKCLTPVCLSEVAELSVRQDEFIRRNCRIAILTHQRLTPTETHAWKADIEAFHEKQFVRMPWPIIHSPELVESLGLLEKGTGLPMRATIFIGPDRTVRVMNFYPLVLGRSTDEMIRTLDGLHRCEAGPFAAPCNWKRGDNLHLLPSVTDEQMRDEHPVHKQVLLPSHETGEVNYLRVVPDPMDGRIGYVLHSKQAKEYKEARTKASKARAALARSDGDPGDDPAASEAKSDGAGAATGGAGGGSASSGSGKSSRKSSRRSSFGTSVATSDFREDTKELRGGRLLVLTDGPGYEARAASARFSKSTAETATSYSIRMTLLDSKAGGGAGSGSGGLGLDEGGPG